MDATESEMTEVDYMVKEVREQGGQSLMAPSGTVEVCRGPAAPRDASGAEVCVPCVCRSLA